MRLYYFINFLYQVILAWAPICRLIGINPTSKCLSAISESLSRASWVLENKFKGWSSCHHIFSFGGRWLQELPAPRSLHISHSGHKQQPIPASRRDDAFCPGQSHLCWQGKNVPSWGWRDSQLLCPCHLPSSLSPSPYGSFLRSESFSLTLPDVSSELDVGVEEEGRMRDICAPLQLAPHRECSITALQVLHHVSVFLSRPQTPYLPQCMPYIRLLVGAHWLSRILW